MAAPRHSSLASSSSFSAPSPRLLPWERWPRSSLVRLLFAFYGFNMLMCRKVAGAQYHWTYHLAPSSVKRFATWVQGWATWFGYVSLLAAIANVTIILLESMIALNHPNYVAGGWHTSVLVIAMCLVHGFLNIYAFKLIPWIELVAGVLHVCLFVIFVVVLVVMGPRNPSSFWLSRNISSGWENTYVAWNLGMLTCVWSFTGKLPSSTSYCRI